MSHRPLARASAEQAFITACTLDVAVRKAGNVSVHSAGHGMQARQFTDSARAAAPALCQAGAAVGVRIEAAVAASWLAAGCNTNLGIVLLCAPLAAATDLADRADRASAIDGAGRADLAAGAAAGAPRDPARLRAALQRVLDGLGPADARAAFAAIARASPGGLGDAPDHDVRQPPRIGLLQAMQLAAPRDSIARQYANGLADLFDTGLPALEGAGAPGQVEAVLRVYLAFAANWPDSHIVRKHGEAVAHSVMSAAQGFAQRAAQGEPLHDDPRWLAWDEQLKQARLNPGTSADLTVATLMLADWLGRLPAGDRVASVAGASATTWHGT